jgi:hypothetical protein
MLSQIIITQSIPTFPSSVDVLIAPEDDHLKISFVRAVQKFISTSPIKDKRKIIQIPNAGRLTLTAQNALLKTLEEPPEYAQINLYLTHRDQLLPTILSRCLIINQTQSENLTSHESEILSKLDSSLPDRMLLADTYAKNRDLALSTCQDLINSLRQLQFSSPTKNNAHRLKLFHEGFVHLKGNSNPHLTLEHIFIHWND